MPLPSQISLFTPPPRESSVRVGPAGWNYKDWEGVVYPAGAGKSFDALAFLADYFDTVEINSSFYSPPRPADAAKWARRVHKNPRFRFTAKVWQRLTHELEDAGGTLEADCGQVRQAMAPLAEAGVLGALLIQFPWSYRCTEQNIEHLGRVFIELHELRLVVEVRHGSWESESAYELLRQNGVGLCNVDQPVIGNSLKPGARVTAQVGYLRLHGRNYQNWFKDGAGRDARYDYLYTKEEIREMAGLARNIKQSADETYVITNNHFRGQALVNALEILEELDARPPAVPPALAAAYPARFPVR
jgi:uncharacterized protein YecE (DUF72 family)